MSVALIKQFFKLSAKSINVTHINSTCVWIKLEKNGPNNLNLIMMFV